MISDSPLNETPDLTTRSRVIHGTDNPDFGSDENPTFEETLKGVGVLRSETAEPEPLTGQKSSVAETGVASSNPELNGQASSLDAGHSGLFSSTEAPAILNGFFKFDPRWRFSESAIAGAKNRVQRRAPDSSQMIAIGKEPVESEAVQKPVELAKSKSPETPAEEKGAIILATRRDCTAGDHRPETNGNEPSIGSRAEEAPKYAFFKKTHAVQIRIEKPAEPEAVPKPVASAEAKPPRLSVGTKVTAKPDIRAEIMTGPDRREVQEDAPVDFGRGAEAPGKASESGIFGKAHGDFRTAVESEDDPGAAEPKAVQKPGASAEVKPPRLSVGAKVTATPDIRTEIVTGPDRREVQEDAPADFGRGAEESGKAPESGIYGKGHGDSRTAVESEDDSGGAEPKAVPKPVASADVKPPRLSVGAKVTAPPDIRAEIVTGPDRREMQEDAPADFGRGAEAPGKAPESGIYGKAHGDSRTAVESEDDSGVVEPKAVPKPVGSAEVRPPRLSIGAKVTARADIRTEIVTGPDRREVQEDAPADFGRGAEESGKAPESGIYGKGHGDSRTGVESEDNPGAAEPKAVPKPVASAEVKPPRLSVGAKVTGRPDIRTEIVTGLDRREMQEEDSPVDFEKGGAEARGKAPESGIYGKAHGDSRTAVESEDDSEGGESGAVLKLVGSAEVKPPQASAGKKGPIWQDLRTEIVTGSGPVESEAAQKQIKGVGLTPPPASAGEKGSEITEISIESASGDRRREMREDITGIIERIKEKEPEKRPEVSHESTIAGKYPELRTGRESETGAAEPKTLQEPAVRREPESSQASGKKEGVADPEIRSESREEEGYLKPPGPAQKTAHVAEVKTPGASVGEKAGATPEIRIETAAGPDRLKMREDAPAGKQNGREERAEETPAMPVIKLMGKSTLEPRTSTGGNDLKQAESELAVRSVVLATEALGGEKWSQIPEIRIESAEGDHRPEMREDAPVPFEIGKEDEERPQRQVGPKPIPVSKAFVDEGRQTPSTGTFRPSEIPSRAIPQTVVLRQVVEKGILNLRDGRSEMQITLKPENLGSLRLRISTENHQVAVKILTELPLIKEIIEQNLTQLKTDIQNQGLKIDSFEVSVARDFGQQGERHSDPALPERGGRDDSEEMARGERDDRKESPERRKRTGRVDTYA